MHRLQRNEEALKKCLELPQTDIKTRLLIAQINYKLANYTKASSQYIELLQDLSDGDKIELATNLMACAANDYSLTNLIE